MRKLLSPYSDSSEITQLLVDEARVSVKDGKFYGVENAVYVNGGKVTVHKGYFSASNGKAWASKKNPTKLDKVFKIAKNAKVAQKNWKSGKKSTIKVTSK